MLSALPLEFIMSALLSVTITVKNQDKLKEYISQVPATMAPHGAKMIGRGKLVKTLNGELSHHIEALFEFPNSSAIEAWFHSKDYQSLIEVREEAAHMTIAILESF